MADAGILYVTHRVPWPPDRGDRIRTWNILKFLSSRAPVDLACLSDEPVTDEIRQTLERVTRRTAIIPHQGALRYVRGMGSLLRGRSISEGMFESPELRRVIRDWRQMTDWTAAIASSSAIAPMIESPMTSDRTVRWIDFMDVDSQKWLDYSRNSAFPKSLIYKTESKRLRKTEIRLATTCDRVLVVTDAEQQIFQQFCPNGRILAIPNGVDTSWFAPRTNPLPQKKVCTFIGVMNYLPNVDAVCWFARKVWPQIYSDNPDAEFRIVGKAPAPEVQALEKQPGIRVVGPVADVRPWLNESTCAVIPLRIARGIQNKVLEAMACGVPVVCSPGPLKGLAARPGLHLLSAETPGEWVENIDRLFRDPSLQQDLGLAGSTWVQTHHCWDACLTPFLKLTSRRNPVAGAALVSRSEVTR